MCTYIIMSVNERNGRSSQALQVFQTDFLSPQNSRMHPMRKNAVQPCNIWNVTYVPRVPSETAVAPDYLFFSYHLHAWLSHNKQRLLLSNWSCLIFAILSEFFCLISKRDEEYLIILVNKHVFDQLWIHLCFLYNRLLCPVLTNCL